MANEWKTSRRRILISRPLVMAILNVTPDSFSDGGKFLTADDALRQAEKLVTEGADLIDIGGESSRPGSIQLSEQDEIERVLPVVTAVAKRFDVPISIDTTKSAVAARALDAGAEIINDISGLRWDAGIAAAAAGTGAGLVLMHSIGSFETMHHHFPEAVILAEVTSGLQTAVDTATTYGVTSSQIVIDPGLGFGKTLEQNMMLLNRLDELVHRCPKVPMLIGASRKSFIGKVLGSRSPMDRLGGSLAVAVAAAARGAKILRVHDVKETVAALSMGRVLNLF